MIEDSRCGHRVRLSQPQWLRRGRWAWASFVPQLRREACRVCSTRLALAGRRCSHPSGQVSLNCTEHLNCSGLAFWPLFFLSLCFFFFFFFFCNAGVIMMGRCPWRSAMEPVVPWQLHFLSFHWRHFLAQPLLVMGLSAEPQLPLCLVNSAGMWHFGALECWRLRNRVHVHLSRLPPSLPPPSVPPLTPHASTPPTPAFTQGRPPTVFPPSFLEAL